MSIPRGVMYGTVRRYVLLGMDTVCRYVLLGTGTVRLRYVGTLRGYGTWVRSVGTAYWYRYGGYAFSENRYGGYTTPVRRTYGPYPGTAPAS